MKVFYTLTVAAVVLFQAHDARGFVATGEAMLSDNAALQIPVTVTPGLVSVLLEVTSIAEPVLIDLKTGPSGQPFDPPATLLIVLTNSTPVPWLQMDVEIGSVLNDVFAASAAVALVPPDLEDAGPAIPIGPGQWSFDNVTGVPPDISQLLTFPVVSIPAESLAVRLTISDVPEPGIAVTAAVALGLLGRRPRSA